MATEAIYMMIGLKGCLSDLGTHVPFTLGSFIIALPADLLKASGRSGEGNGNPLQYSCLGTPMERGAWWAAVYGVAQTEAMQQQQQQQWQEKGLEGCGWVAWVGGSCGPALEAIDIH